MDDHAFKVLEFSDLLKLLGSYTKSAQGRKLIERFQPIHKKGLLTHLQKQYAEGITLLVKGESLPGLYHEDISEPLKLVAPTGAILPGEDLNNIANVLEISEDLLKFFQREEVQECSTLLNLSSKITSCQPLLLALRHALDPTGYVMDNASVKLAEIRRGMNQMQLRIQSTLESMIKHEYADIMQENFVTNRNGRYVIPIKREEKSNISGVVHDFSNTGNTIFIEPSKTMIMGNELASLHGEERDEVRRILAELSDKVRLQREEIENNLRIAGKLDAIFGVARWARENKCNIPTFGKNINIKKARHPLLLQQFKSADREEDLVPLNLRLESKYKILAITGSNTGGKTVAMKTVGLLTLMGRAGLPIPADEETCLPDVDRVFADIGDEQSINDNLSTFSAHMANIQEILDKAHPRTLVLLDELGSGTDPLEGGSLACAILDELCNRKVLTLCTTHLGMVKTYVHNTEGKMNASVRFNSDDLKPEYILDIGRPGASHALAIARRLGVSKRVLNNAESFMDKDHIKLENVLQRMESDQRDISKKQAEMNTAHDNILRDRDELKQELKDLKKERKKLLNEAYKQSETIIDNTRRQMNKMMQELNQTLGKDQERSNQFKDMQEQLEEKRRKVRTGQQQTQSKVKQPLKPQDISIGSTVWVNKLKAKGKVVSTSSDKRKIEVEVGSIRFTVSIREIGHAPSEKKVKETTVSVRKPRLERAPDYELNLIGLCVDDALIKLEGFLDKAYLAHMPEVRIVHGFGTGALRNGVHDWLRKQSYVNSFRLGRHGEDTGGGGATVVQFSKE